MVGNMLRLDKAALLWLLKKAEVVLMQSTVHWALAHVGHRQAVWN